MMAIYQARFQRYMENRGMVPGIRSQGLGLSRRRRNGRAGDAWARSRCRCARSSTTWCSSSTATCSGSTGRCAATARSSRNSRPRSWARAGTSSRCSGARAGIRCWRATRDGLLRRVMEECVDGEYQNFKAKGGAYTRENFFGKYPRAQGNGRQHVGRRHLAPEPRRPRCRQGVRGLCGGDESQGPAHRDPRQDREGFRPRQGGRRPDGGAPAEEARRGQRCERVPRPLQHPAHRRAGLQARAGEAGRRRAGDEIPAREAQVARWLSTARARSSRSRW